MKKPYDTQEVKGNPIGTLRIAKITYDHETITDGGTATIGEVIDEHIRSRLESGALISEVALLFETYEQQHALVAMYRRA